MQFIYNLFDHYGYILLTISLMLELIALPLPGQTIMTYCGYVISRENMSWTLGILMAALGGILGITISHFIGKILGKTFFEKYGHYIHLDKTKLEKISGWFEKYGYFLLFIAYFIPGIRHIMGYFSGIIKLSLKKFMISAYLGALMWTGTFISLGNFLGKNWFSYQAAIKKYAFFSILTILIIACVFYIWNRSKKNNQ